jgi:hypothetical protein
MNSMPLMDHIGLLVPAGIFLVLFLLQWRFPLRCQYFHLLRRLIRNFVFSIPGFAIVRFATLPIPLALAAWAQKLHVGFTELDANAAMDCDHRNVSVDGLCVLVVALG